jgi:hypothetical protein
MLVTNKTDQFVKAWIAGNVHHVPDLEDLPCEVDRLSAKLTADARAVGIRGVELSRSVGDIDDYLTNAYEQVRDPKSEFQVP